MASTKPKGHGTRTYASQRRGTNTAVRRNQMTRHTTPSRSTAVSRSGRTQGRLKTSAKYTKRTGRAYTWNVTQVDKSKIYNAQGKKIGVSRTNTAKIANVKFKAPRSMPSRLNNAAAASISSQRYVSAGIALGGTTVGNIAIFQGYQTAGRQNNYATLRLRAGGYRVGGTGLRGKIKPLKSNRSRARAAKQLVKVQRKDQKRGISTRTGSFAPNTHGRNKGKRTGGYVQTNKIKRRYRRDSKGQYAGSY